MPSTPGIRMSISTTSGRSVRTASIAADPSPASPTTSRSGCASRIMRKPARTSAWSSTIRTLIMPPPCPPPEGEGVLAGIEGQAGVDGEAAGGIAPRAQFLDQACQLTDAGLWAAIGGGAVASAQHAEQPVQLDQGLARRRFDQAEGLRGCRGAGVLHGTRRAGLDRNHADIVRDHVMELARNSGPLLVGRELPVLIPLALESRGAFLQLGDVGAPGPKVITNQPGGHEEDARDNDRE